MPQAGANANPMAAMMQQMMSNPAMMQQSMQMAQMFGGQPGMFGEQAVEEEDDSAPQDDAVLRVRFASQLTQLSAMGFCNESACLRALQRHQGRIDAAIDTLLSSGEGS